MSTVNFGPLQKMIGTWKGDNGVDVAPEPDGSENTPFFETITIEAVGDVTNAGKQALAVVSYHQVVSRKADGEVFHDQRGYWTWDAATGVISHSVNIPRAVAVLAGGSVTEEGAKTVFKVAAKAGADDWGIVQSPFMLENAKTTAFEMEVSVEGDTLTYSETTSLDIYGKAFAHTDGNTLTRA